MSTNLEFRSNVYPFVGYMESDKSYLSKIEDFNKLKELDKRIYQKGIWSTFQKRIIAELPNCSLDKYHDPCWGLLKTETGYKWECRCLNTECISFTNCRPNFDESELVMFSPLHNCLTGYHYSFTKENHPVHPVVFTGEDASYGSFAEYQGKTKPAEENALPGGEDIPVVDIIQAIKVMDEPTPVVQEEDTTVVIKQSTTFENPKKATSGYAQDNTIEVPKNIFDCFKFCEQEDIISAAPSQVMFVDAGPGTGKTYTLIKKINYLVTEHQIDPEGILVLCFTNSAVDEVRSRLKEYISLGADRGLANVDIRTFHSFAWWLICQANEIFLDDGWHRVPIGTLNYDASLRVATEIMRKFASRVVDSWAHFIVDEVQDLTNNLAQFVLQIVEACLDVGCGISVFGDSCQAIYDYNQEFSPATMTSDEFYCALFNKLYGTARFVKLSINHRQTDALIDITSGLRTAILSQDKQQMSSSVNDLMQNITTIDINALTIQDDDLNRLRKGGRICLLFRNNGQTLKMSSVLRKRGIPHVLNAYETHQNYAPWISEVFSEYYKSNISYDEFKTKYEAVLSVYSQINAEDIWERLQRLLHSHNGAMQVADILHAICESKIDDPMLRMRQTGDVIVSNIHRAKGREYDCVVLDKSFAESLIAMERDFVEYKTMYVAATRPKKALVAAPLQKAEDLNILKIYDSKRRRWGKSKNKKLTYFEFNSTTDLDMDSFAIVDQKYLTRIKNGDPIELRRKIIGTHISYDIVHHSGDHPVIIGQVGRSYIDDMLSYMKNSISSLIEMPALIDDLYVSGIYSNIVMEDYLQLRPHIKQASPNGVWKWIELVGVGHANYDVY